MSSHPTVTSPYAAAPLALPHLHPSSSHASWQEEIRQRLLLRNTREQGHSDIIEQYRRLAQQTRVLRERNQTLLRAVGTARASGSTGVPGDDNPVRAALITSLESQISSMRDELAGMYKTQGQNAQRLLEMNDALRSREESSRVEGDDLRRTREELDRARRELEGVRLNLREKERFIQELSDDNNALSLELTQTAARNDNLKRDNATLLQRWLDAKNDEAARMNEANTFFEEMQLARTRSPPAGVNGSGAENGDGDATVQEINGSGPAMGGSGLGSALGLQPGFRSSPKSPARRPKSEMGRENG